MKYIYNPYGSSKTLLAKLLNPLNWKTFLKIQKIKNEKRCKEGKFNLMGYETKYVDSLSFLSAYSAIFESKIYSFNPKNTPPTIIDGGANIGLATLYWKSEWPNANVIAFEPDPTVYGILEWNLQQHGCSDVALVQKGLWSTDTTLQFHPDGADGGHLDEDTSRAEADRKDEKSISVPVVPLAPYLDQPVDMLKLDIEGAEIEVLLDCADKLDRVENLFVEYHSFVEQSQRVDELLSVIRKAGFRIHIQPELVAERPFLDRLNEHGMDHRLNIFGYRE